MSTISGQPRIHIGTIIHNAVVFNLKYWRETSVNTDDLL